MDIREKTVGEVAAEVPAAIRIFEKLHIDYCCGGMRPLAEACAQAGVTVSEFLQELGRSAAPPTAVDCSKLSIAELSKYIIETFHVHAREELETLKLIAAKVLSVHGQRHPELRVVTTLVGALEEDMLPHMMKEEMILFPFCDSLERGSGNGSCFGSVENPIRMMTYEHEQVGELLRQLRAASNGFALPDDACFSYTQLYRRLEEFEKETHQHIHIENNIYFPRAVELEQSVVA